MKMLFSLLDARERNILRTAAVLSGFAAAAFLLFAVRAEVRAGRESRRLAAAEERVREAERNRGAAERELERWTVAQADIRELASKWFYDPAQGVPGLRYDLRAIFQETGIAAPEINYNEVDLVRGRLRRVTAEFRLAGSYILLRRFLEAVEKHPKALHVEKIDFEDIGTQPGLVQVRAVLSGYFLHEK